MPEEPDPEAQRGDHIAEDVSCAHCDAPRRHRGPRTDVLSRVGEEALEDRSAEARPDQPFRNMRVRRVELMQVRVRLPLLEQSSICQRNR